MENNKDQSGLMTLQETLNNAERFISGFEDDDIREEPVTKLLESIRHYMNKSIEVLVYVEGGLIQGASATMSINFNVFDKDEYDNGTLGERLAFIKQNGTPEEWNKMIEERTKSGEIVGIY